MTDPRDIHWSLAEYRAQELNEAERAVLSLFEAVARPAVSYVELSQPRENDNAQSNP